jgi:U3 small nucleolar RNA-associated protein 5
MASKHLISTPTSSESSATKPSTASLFSSLSDSFSKKRKSTSTVTAAAHPNLNANASTPQSVRLSSALESNKRRKRSQDPLSVPLAQRLKQRERSLIAKDLEQLSDGQTPKTGSLQTILTQALHSNDKTLLEYCLAEGGRSSTVIRETVERLPLKFVLPLLNSVVERFRSKPSRGVYLMAWIRQILNSHTSYLMSVPEVGASLAGLYQAIDHRMGVFKKLLQLQGRLDLVMAQQGVMGGGSQEDDVAPSGPLNTYTEQDGNALSEDESGDSEDNEQDDDDDDEDEDDGDGDGDESYSE